MEKNKNLLQDIAINKAISRDQKKINVSFKMNESFKNELQEIANKNNITFTSLLNSMLEVCHAYQNKKY